MGGSSSKNNVPFNFQFPSSCRDPNNAIFAIEELERLKSINDASNIALGYLHNPEEFASVWNSNRPHPDTRRLMRELVQIQTINAVCNGFYRLPDCTKINLNIQKMISSAENTKQYCNDHHYNPLRLQHTYEKPAEIFVINGDCIDTVQYLKKKYPTCNPVVLNMANAHCPGGGWRSGCGAQEENLHRRTNLFQCLEDSYHQLKGKRNWHYPIPEFGGLYSPDVSVFRGSESRGYPFFPNGPEYISFIACAAYANPPRTMNQNGGAELSGKNLINNTKNKINTILKIAVDNDHDTIILSAFGCGAFRNPPGHIARLFHEVINQNYLYSFKYIVFAIIEDHNSKQGHNPNGNIQPFADVFNTKILLINDF